MHYSICEIYTIGKSIDTESKSVFFRGWGEEELGNDCYWKWGFYFDENTSVIGDDGYNNLVNILKTTELYT